MSYYECPKCGAQTDIDKSVLTRCPICGDPVPQEQQESMREHVKLMKEVNDILTDDNFESSDIFDDNTYIHCPRCLSSRLTVRKKGYSVGRATAGSLLGAKDAWLWGMWGMDDKMCTCNSCGYKFDANLGTKGTKKQINNVKNYIESNLRTETDAKIISNVGSRFNVAVSDSYLHRLRKRKGISANPGFSFLNLLAVFICSIIPAGICYIFFDMNFWLACAGITILGMLILYIKD